MSLGDLVNLLRALSEEEGRCLADTEVLAEIFELGLGENRTTRIVDVVVEDGNVILITEHAI